MDAKVLLTICIFLFSITAKAASNSEISLELGIDDNNGSNYYLSSRLGLEEGLQFKLGLGESISDGPFNGELISETKVVGIKTNPTALFSLGIERNEWSHTSKLETESTIITLEMNTHNWNVYISPESREITVTAIFNQREFSFDSDGQAAGVTYYGWDPISIGYSFITYDYPLQITNIDTRLNRVLFFFSPALVDQVFILEDERKTFEIEYYFDISSVAFSFSEGRSAVDQSISTVRRIYYYWYPSKSWELGISVGDARVNIIDGSLVFASGRVAYRW